jgi:uncharacterized Tic20 family protein
MGVTETEHGLADQVDEGRRVSRRKDEWTVAAMAHAAILITVALGPAGGIGLLVGPVSVLAIYLAYRSRSSFISRHALQALAYQALVSVALALLSVLGLAGIGAAWGWSDFLSKGVLASSGRMTALPFTLIVVGALVSCGLSWLAYGLYAALQVYQGRDYRYWLLGDWLARRFDREW